MIKNKLNFALLIVTAALLIASVTPVMAQQMLLQIVGGGYRFDGPNPVNFPAIAASTAESASTSEISVRDITSSDGYNNPPSVGQPGFILIEDQNGGSPFEIHVEATGALANQSYPSTYQIPLTNFYVKNDTSETNPDIVTIEGRQDGFSLNGSLNAYADLSTDRLLATGTGQAPGTWKFFPGFKLEVPSATPVGTYTTTIIFTVI